MPGGATDTLLRELTLQVSSLGAQITSVAAKLDGLGEEVRAGRTVRTQFRDKSESGEGVRSTPGARAQSWSADGGTAVPTPGPTPAREAAVNEDVLATNPMSDPSLRQLLERDVAFERILDRLKREKQSRARHFAATSDMLGRASTDCVLHPEGRTRVLWNVGMLCMLSITVRPERFELDDRP